ncbi:MAG: UDP-N-acetylmuramate dehydrogenase [Acidiferrobacterales bacterium]|nr:UDP-N-acetylmuramate dehydrogenase [Acidiferrobacterales bacterium]
MKASNFLDIPMHGLKGQLRQDEPMSRHTSWRAGGCASMFYTPKGKDDLGEFLSRVPDDADIAWCGLGSNMLVRDGGFPGVMISTLKGLSTLHKAGETQVYAEAGVPGAKLAKYSVGNSLCDAEFMVGIPGTVGGALAMNAGCFGAETWDIVGHVDTINRSGEQKTKDRDEFDWGYRYVGKDSDEWFTGAQFRLTLCDGNLGKENIRRLLKTRSQTQPIQTANAGSVFRNPPGDYAARLIETAGLKNFQIGQAGISAVHANFIENKGEATASDIENLIDHAVEEVERVHGVRLEPEVRIIGRTTS